MADDLISDFRSYREDTDQNKAHANLSTARPEAPETAARREALAQRWGVGPETAKVQESLLAGAAQAHDDQEALSVAPRTTGFLAADPGNAAITHDHVKDLSLSERLIDGLRATFAPKTYVEAARADENLSATVHALPGAMVGGVHSFVSGLVGVPEAAYDVIGAKNSAAALKRVRNRYEGKAEAYSPKTENILARGIFSGVQSAATTAPAIGVGIAQPEIGMGLMIAPVGGQAYGEARDQGKDIFTSLRYAATQGGAEYATEKIPFGKLMGDIALKAPFWKTVRSQLVREIPGEQIATLLQSFDQWATLDSDKQSFADYLKTLPAQEAETLIATAVNVGANVTAGKALDTGVRKIVERDTKALQAPQTAEALDEVVKATSKLPLLQRSPERFHDAMERLADGVDVAVPAAVVSKYLQEADPEEARTILEGTGIGEQLKAATPEQDIVIRGADYLTFIGPTEAHKAFLQDIKVGPGAISINEAKEHEAEREQLLAQAAERALNRGAEIAQIEDPAERVREHFYQQAIAIGVPEQEARANAALQAAYYSQRAARNSSFADAWEAYVDANVSLKGKGVTTTGPKGLAGNDVFSLFKQQTEEREHFFNRWFSGSKAITREGKPLTVYHATAADFTEFKTEDLSPTSSGPAIWFTPNKTDQPAAHNILDVEGFKEGTRVIPAYVKLRNPLMLDNRTMQDWATKVFADGDQTFPLLLTRDTVETLKAEGYDGIVYMDAKAADYDPNKTHIEDAKEIVVFEPTQVKSTFNNGLFHPYEPNIFQQSADPKLADKVPGLAKVLPYLTEDERRKLTTVSAKNLVKQIAKLPKADEMATVAYAGRAKRGWYQKSAEAILEVFGIQDAPRFAALLAALSSQTSVESNAQNALAVWVGWTRAGRPTEKQAIIDVIGQNVQGDKGVDSILPAWINNSVRALSHPDPGGIQLSGPKVNSFMKNLVGVVDEVTNDAWMANYALVDQAMFKGAGTQKDDLGQVTVKGTGYLAMNAVVRKAAQIVTERTGETWTPAEVQETVWSWAKTLYEKRDSAGEVTTEQLLQAAGLTHDDIGGTPDFQALFAAGVYRNILEAGGYGEEINKLTERRASGDVSVGTGDTFSGEGAGLDEPAFQRHLLRAARRIEQRRFDAREARFQQGPIGDETGMVTLSHWSDRANLKKLDPSKFGKNFDILSDEEKLVLDEAPGRTYWGLGTGQPGEYQPEFGIGPHRYETRIPADKLYDASADPLGLKQKAEDAVRAQIEDGDIADYQAEVLSGFEHAIKAAGFLGYWTPGAGTHSGPVAATFETIQPVYRGRTFEQLEEGVPLQGLPQRIRVDGQVRVFGPFQVARDAAEAYARKAGLPYNPPVDYVKVDEDRARRIAEAYDAMPHNPQDPEVKAAYDAMIAETLAQWQEIKATGLQVEFNPTSEDPYGNPRNAILDVVDNNHLWVFPTAEGFGSSDLDVSDNPLLAEVPGETFSERPVVVNDIFRVVHDYFGHIKEGVGFRAEGEENAWRSHSAMYSPLARRAMTTETRGQNSWVNFGPHGEANRDADPAQTVYADQKIGLLPDWVVNEGAVEPVDTTRMQQGPRGQVSFTSQGALIELFKSRNASTLIHEGAGHVWLENLGRDAQDPNATEQVRIDLQKVKDWWRANLQDAYQEWGLRYGGPTSGGIGRLEKAIDDFGTATPPKADDIRVFHEMFARAAEAYVMEGKSPTEDLRGAFARFRQWLVAIYKDFTRLNVPMSDEIRSVFDRLIATPEAIDGAIQDQGLTPFFADSLQAGMTQAEYDAYVRSIQLADEAAHDRLLGKVMSDVRRKRTAAWKSERGVLLDEYAETVNDTPEMRALTMLEQGEVRLSRQAITDLGFDEAQLYRRSRPYVFDEGLHPDTLAEQVGLSSGEALLQFLAQAKTEHDALRANGDKRTVRQARIETLADNEMVARHGDVLNDGTIGDEAIAAIHDMRRSEVLMAEVRALIRKAGAVTSVWSEDEMQRWARREIAGRQLTGVRPHIFAAAEAKAGRDALKALVTDDFTAALDAKFRQLLNMHLYRAARDARDEITKGKKLFDNVAKARNGTIAKTRNMDMVSAARQIIAAYGFEGRQNDADYMAKVAAYDPELWADLQVPVTAALAGAKPVDELTFDEFTSLVDMVTQLWEMSRTSRQIQIDFQALEAEDIANDLADQLGNVPARPVAYTNRDVALRLVSGVRAALRRVESWVTGVDGGSKGPWRTYIWQPVSEAATRFRTAKAQYLTDFVAILQPIQETLKRGKIEAPELGYTFGTANAGVGKSELLHAILHTGNDSNKRKLLLGRGWATERADGTLDTAAWDKFISRMHTEGVLTQADYDFAQATWDLLERMKPDAQRAHRQVFGRYFEEVTANPVTTPFGVYRGGYVPAIVDTFLVQEQALNAQADAITDSNDASMFPSPNRGFTKARVEYNKPLALDLGLLPQHIDKVLKFSHMTAPVRDVLRLLKEKSLAPKLEAYDPVAIPDLLLPWLNRSARQIVETPSKGSAGKAADSFFRAVRHRTGMGIMMANISNTLQQLTGWAPVLTKVRKRHLTRALLRVTKDPAQAAQDITTMSAFMATRTTSQVHEMASQLDQLLLDPTKYQQVQAFTQKHAYVLQGFAQNYVDMVAWQAGFEQAIEQGQEFEEAVRFADSVIRETQGSLAPEDISRFETGSPFVRLFTQFYSYFGTQSNLVASELKNADGRVSRIGYVYLTAVMIPAVVADLIRRSFGEGWDDDDDDGYLDTWLDVFLGSQFRYLTGFVPLAGQLAATAVNQFNDKRYDDTLVVSPVASTLGAVTRIPKDWVNVIAEGKGEKAVIRDTATLLTLATGVPLFNAAARPAGYLADIHEGKVAPTGPLDFARGLMTGTASKASKVAQ